jgi:hypothetical protein
VKESNALILDQNYENDCFMKISIRKNEEELLKGKLVKIEGLHLVLKD